MSMLNNVTATKAKKMAKFGRNGDTEMAHVTPGEQIIPLNVQTPRLMATAKEEFDKAGVPMDRYRVESSDNSMNPNTGKPEFFLKKLVKAAAPLIGAATGNPLIGAAVGAAAGMGGGGAAAAGGAGGGSAVPYESNPLPEPVKAFVQGGGVNSAPMVPTTTNLYPSPEQSMESMLRSQMMEQRGDEMASPALRAVGSGNIDSVIASPSNVPQRVSRNPVTGEQEFYSSSGNATMYNSEMGTPSRNPATGKQEFAATPQNYNQQVAANVAAKYGISIPSFGDGKAMAAIAANPSALADFNNTVAQQPAGWGATPTANASQPAASTSSAPAATTAAPAAVTAPPKKTIVNITQSNPLGTTPTTYGMNGYTGDTVIYSDGTTEKYGDFFAREIGNQYSGGSDFKNYIGKSYGGTTPEAPKAAPATATSASGVVKDTTGSNAVNTVLTNTANTQNTNQTSTRPNDVFGYQEQERPSWYYGMENTLKQLQDSYNKLTTPATDPNASTGDTSSTTSSSSSSGSSPNDNLSGVSTLTPQRGNRFRPGGRTGTLARNF